MWVGFLLFGGYGWGDGVILVIVWSVYIGVVMVLRLFFDFSCRWKVV